MLPRPITSFGRRCTRFSALALAGALALTACSSTGATEPGATSASASASSTQTPAFDLRTPGNARQVIDFLAQACGNKPILRVEITESAAKITYLDDDQAHTIGYADGHISQLDSTVKYIQQTTFDPADFAIDDVGALFDRAGEISGSRQQQDLQINQYNQGVVLMTVTTTPETSTVFFRADGSAVNTLDFTTEDGLREGLSDTVQGASSVESVEIKTDSLTTEVRTGDETVERRSRQKSLPSITSTLKNSGQDTGFDPSLIDPALIARLQQSLPASQGATPSSEVDIAIERRNGTSEPRMYFHFSSGDVITTLSGELVSK